MRLLAVLQARFSSSRLPGKVLKPVLGEPMLLRQAQRIALSTGIDKLIVATSTAVSDDVIADMCRDRGVACFRGELDDVLDRFYQAAQAYQPECIMRLTGDCPLFDPQLADSLSEFFWAGGYDYASNCYPPTYPDGLDMEIMKFPVLERAWREAKLPSEREHVTPFIRKYPESFSQGTLLNGEDLSGLRWTVDEPEDYDLICRIYERLHPQNPAFGFMEVLSLLRQQPELAQINAKFRRNEGYERSLLNDMKERA